jgi:hypothetical protein
MNEIVPTTPQDKKEVAWLLTAVFTGIQLFNRAGRDPIGVIIRDAEEAATTLVDKAPTP